MITPTPKDGQVQPGEMLLQPVLRLVVVADGVLDGLDPPRTCRHGVLLVPAAAGFRVVVLAASHGADGAACLR
jgi:hypothetical protein